MRPLSIATLAAALLASACSIHFRDHDWDLFGNLPKATREESETLDLKPGWTLRIDGATGDVRVRVDSAAAPRVDARWTAQAEERVDAEDLLARSSLEIEKIVGGEVPTIRVGLKTSDPPARRGNVLLIRARADLDFTIPPDVSLRIETRYGDVSVNGPVGAVTIDASQSDVRVVDAKETHVTSLSGKICLERIRGRVEVSSEYDSIEIADVDGPAIRAKSRSGEIRLADASADQVDLEASYGDVSLDRVAPRGRAAEVTVTAQSGDLVARDVAGALEMSTRSGAIRIDGFRGELRARSEYGDLSIDGELAALDAESRSGKIRVVARSGSRVATPWRIETRYDDVLLDVPRDLDAEIDAVTTYGTISGDLDVKSSGGADRTRGHAKAGAGGGTIDVATSNGDVRILRR